MASRCGRASIAIVGGSPAGLCLGALLHRRRVPFTIYELRDAPAAAALDTPSGMLDLHVESGLAALRACGLWDRFQPLTADCAESMLIRAPDGAVRYRDDGADAGRPEVARNALTHLLLSATPAASVNWRHKLRAATRTPAGAVRLDFGAQGTREHDVVVGADGAWSRVRPLLTAARPVYGGVSYATLRIPAATVRRPALAALVGPGSCCILGGGNGLFTHRGVGGSIILYVAVASAAENALGDRTRGLAPAQLRDLLLGDPALFAAWGHDARALVSAACDDEAALSGPLAPPLRPLYMLPVGLEWPSARGAALIGDAAHLMMPWAGEGVNLAMRDALDLAEAVAAAWDEAPAAAAFQEALQPRVFEFEGAMFARAKAAAEETWSNSKIIFSEDGATAMANLMTGFAPPAGQGDAGKSESLK